MRGGKWMFIDNIDEEIEVAALRSFRDSIDNTLKDYMKSGITRIIGGLNAAKPFPFPPDEIIEMLTMMITDQLKWRYEY
jgi:hypothetical protein